jgi:hypothetical protein
VPKPLKRQRLLAAGFEYVTEKEGVMLFRKRM